MSALMSHVTADPTVAPGPTAIATTIMMSKIGITRARSSAVVVRPLAVRLHHRPRQLSRSRSGRGRSSPQGGSGICCRSSWSRRVRLSWMCRPHWRLECECLARAGRTRTTRTTRGPSRSPHYGRRRCGRSRSPTTRRCCAGWRNATSISVVTAPASCAAFTPR